MRIGIDIDDTIADTYEVAFAYAQRYTINELRRDGEIQDITAKHHSYLNAMHNWNNEEEMNFWYEHYGENVSMLESDTHRFYDSKKDHDDIEKLKEEGHEIIIVTARWPEENCDVYGKSLEWLEANKIQYDDIVFNASDKGKVALEKKLDLFIDDSFKNCTDVAKTGVKTYIMETRTNKGLESENIERVYSWPDIYNRIKREENI